MARSSCRRASSVSTAGHASAAPLADGGDRDTAEAGAAGDSAADCAVSCGGTSDGGLRELSPASGFAKRLSFENNDAVSNFRGSPFESVWHATVAVRVATSSVFVSGRHPYGTTGEYELGPKPSDAGSSKYLKEE